MGLSRWIKEPFPGLSHALGALLSAGALIALLASATARWQVVSFTIFGISMVLVYTASACTHSLRGTPAQELWLDRFDYMAIYALIAGTYTPICLGPLRGPWGWTLLSIEWGLAAIGMSTVLFMRGRTGLSRTIAYAVMGWMALVAIVPLCHALPAAALIWLFAGGVIYSAGAVVFTTNRPKLWPGRFSSHDLWHCMVLAGSACHFILVIGFIA